eukprot:TRINITY_DN4669_c0_g1_i1.p1 TRINITY_DN4669_c0_g1~~TRINITY_DN4669_c0_g1_i1.p1  ORF type:complete len:896 (-),score=180.11 TRINITY_DN4669_c0_g1_i1:168-2708(-)
MESPSRECCDEGSVATAENEIEIGGEAKPQPRAHSNDSESAVGATTKRKKEEGEEKDPMWKTSLCSYFRRSSNDCKHGQLCKYAHGEAELRPRPDNTWDPTSLRAKKAKTNSNSSPIHCDEQHRESILCNSNDLNTTPEHADTGAAQLQKCVIHLPKYWSVDNFKTFLQRLEVLHANCRKRKGMTVGFVEFSSPEDVTKATEKLNGQRINKKTLKVADVLRSWEEQSKSGADGGKHNQSTKDSKTLSSVDTDFMESLTDNLSCGTDQMKSKNSCDEVVLPRKARDAVTPLADMPYDEQLSQKKNSVSQLLKKLTKNARKACPTGAPLPEWMVSSRTRGGLPCELEGIMSSPIVNGYRNKCEFTVGLSKEGERVVGFLLGNFREGLTAVEEPTDCPNVSSIACRYAMIFQNFIRSSELPVWNKHENKGFWRLLTVREGHASCQSSESSIEQNHIAEVMLIVQICSIGIEENVRSNELKRMAENFVLEATTASPALPLTALVVQDHLGISNAAPADAPLYPLLLPVVINGTISGADCKQPQSQIHDYVNNLCFRISPTAFFQVNTLAAEKLYSLAGDWAALSSSTLLFDICCGTGTIGLTLARRTGMVIGIEMNASAVADAQRNAELNGIQNCKFICAKAEDVIDSLLEEYLEVPTDTNAEVLKETIENEGKEISKNCTNENDKLNHPLQTAKETELDNSADSENGDTKITSLEECAEANGRPKNMKEGNAMKKFKDVVAIVDPPRSGLHPTVIKALRTHSLLRRLVYISCNPETLVANAIELCTPTTEKMEKTKGNKGGFKFMGNIGHARHRVKSMPMSEPFYPVKAMAVDLFPHTPHCEMVMLLER